MEMLFLPALGGIVLAGLLLKPLRLGGKLVAHGFCGLLCLWLLNQASGITGLILPINAVTVLLSGVLGLPGIALVVLLELGG